MSSQLQRRFERNEDVGETDPVTPKHTDEKRPAQSGRGQNARWQKTAKWELVNVE
jgi:hypothetical protein